MSHKEQMKLLHRDITGLVSALVEIQFQTDVNGLPWDLLDVSTTKLEAGLVILEDAILHWPALDSKEGS